MMKLFTRLALAAFLVAPLLLHAQAYPTHPIRLIVPYPAGGTADVLARALQEPIQRALGQPVIVENKTGAGGALAAREVAKSPADGHTLFLSNASIHAITPRVLRSPGFDGVKDFAPIAQIATTHLYVFVNGQLPVNDLKGFIEYARKQRHPLTYASAGIGSFGHLSTELFAKRAGIKMVHIPYRGQAATTQAVMSGEVPLVITTTSGPMTDFVASGKLKLLAVTSTLPSPLAPRVPAVSSVLSGYSAESWFGIVASAGTPEAVVRRLNSVINATLANPEMQQRFANVGMEVRTGTPKRLGELLQQEVTRWAPVIRDSNIQPE
jgi:tripartite-type tricarboxylate transporter receptor subunit TctC